MQEEASPRFLLTYISLFLGGGLLAIVSMLLAPVNPIGGALIAVTHPLLALSGAEPASVLSVNTSRQIVNLLWPLSLVPLQIVTMVLFKWPWWKYLLLLVGLNLLMAFAVQRIDLGM